MIPEIEIRQEATIIPNNTTVDFGSYRIGESNTLTFSIKNKDLGNLNLSGTPKIVLVGIHSADFSINESATSGSLVENETTTFSITFTPTANGNRTANISITNNDDDKNPFIINLSGNGAAPPNILVTSNLNPVSYTHLTLPTICSV